MLPNNTMTIDKKNSIEMATDSIIGKIGFLFCIGFCSGDSICIMFCKLLVDKMTIGHIS